MYAISFCNTRLEHVISKSLLQVKETSWSYKLQGINQYHWLPLLFPSNSLSKTGLKKLVDWPTFPMIFLDSELIGGLDILKEQLETGEFQEMMASSWMENSRNPRWSLHLNPWKTFHRRNFSKLLRRSQGFLLLIRYHPLIVLIKKSTLFNKTLFNIDFLFFQKPLL